MTPKDLAEERAENFAATFDLCDETKLHLASSFEAHARLAARAAYECGARRMRSAAMYTVAGMCCEKLNDGARARVLDFLKAIDPAVVTQAAHMVGEEHQ